MAVNSSSSLVSVNSSMANTKDAVDDRELEWDPDAQVFLAEGTAVPNSSMHWLC